MKAKIIKKKDYEATETAPAGTFYTLAYKGRVFGLFPHNFEAKDIVIDETTNEVTIKIKPQITLREVADPETGAIRKFASLVPEMDLAVDYTAQ